MATANLAGTKLEVWESSAEKHPAINIAGVEAEDGESYSIELHVRRGAIVGVVVCGTDGIVGRHGLTPTEEPS